MHIKTYLIEKKVLIDQSLEAYLAQEKGEFPDVLFRSMRHSLMAGGKRLRPVLMFAACEAVGGSSDNVMPAALAMEMIHTFSLIHDDLPAMDDDDLRRGVPTNHKVFGEATAILAGDALLNEAYRCMLGRWRNEGGISPVMAEVMEDICRATGIFGMIKGQIIDLESEDKEIPLQELEELHKNKTGALIRVSVTSGAKLAGASPKQVEALEVYAEKIGLAFQVADDILDIEGTQEEIGKPVGSDIENNKSTYPKLIGIEESKKLCEKLVEEALVALKDFDDRAEALRLIAKYIIERRG